MTFDAIGAALLQKKLDQIARQMGWVMSRTARSPIFSESHDFSCFITDNLGRLLSVADGVPIHTGGGTFAVEAVIRDFAEEMAEGDVFLLSDPYEAGGNHLPDWTMIRPVFDRSALRGFVCNRAHQSDIGGGAAGTYNAEAREIFHEGIRLPVLRLVVDGKIRPDLWRLLLLNTRYPELMDGDLRAMLGSTVIGHDKFSILCSEYDSLKLDQAFADIMDLAERQLKSEIMMIEEGQYAGSDVSDNDVFSNTEVEVLCNLKVENGILLFDFSGSSAQIDGFKNSSLANTHSAVYMAVLSFFPAQVSRNHGAFRNIEIIAPEGTVVNARPPAPMTMNTVHPTSEIVHACWKALGEALPMRACAGWGKTSHCVSAGKREGGSRYVMYHWHASAGGGAVDGRDGFNTIGQLCTLGGMPIPNVEVYEQLYPVKISKQEFRKDAAGPGKYRGGAGVDYVVEIFEEAEYSFRGEGIRTPTGFGVNGGNSGASGHLNIALSTGQVEEIPQYGVRTLGPLTLEISSAGGGGFGDPKDRCRDLVRRDLADGLISTSAARDIYGLSME